MEKSIAHPHVYTLVAVCIKVFDRPANNKNVKCVLRSSKWKSCLCKTVQILCFVEYIVQERSNNWTLVQQVVTSWFLQRIPFLSTV